MEISALVQCFHFSILTLSYYISMHSELWKFDKKTHLQCQTPPEIQIPTEWIVNCLNTWPLAWEYLINCTYLLPEARGHHKVYYVHVIMIKMTAMQIMQCTFNEKTRIIFLHLSLLLAFTTVCKYWGPIYMYLIYLAN
jgi:hypothetical protein